MRGTVEADVLLLLQLSLQKSKYSTTMTPRIIHLVRHGEGFHQLQPLNEHRQIHDATLTEQGVERCKTFGKTFPYTDQIDLVCASPLRRAIQTAQYCFASVLARPDPERILFLPYAQEDTDEPCDVGSPLEVLRKDYAQTADFSHMSEDWNGKSGVYAPTTKALKERAWTLRLWLKSRSENEIVVVGHGSFWHWTTGEIDREGHLTGTSTEPCP